MASEARPTKCSRDELTVHLIICVAAAKRLARGSQESETPKKESITRPRSMHRSKHDCIWKLALTHSEQSYTFYHRAARSGMHTSRGFVRQRGNSSHQPGDVPGYKQGRLPSALFSEPRYANRGSIASQWTMKLQHTVKGYPCDDVIEQSSL
jgi:hypothetical protein